jgi:hypothetical protein
MGYLARSGDQSTHGLSRAMIYGAAMGSYAVSHFGIRGFEQVTRERVEERAHDFQDLTQVSLLEPLP